MSFLAGSVIGHLELDTGGFTSGFLQAQGLMQLFPGFVSTFLANPLLGFAQLAKDAMKTVADSFLAAQSRADDLSVASANLGVSAHELSRLSAAASAFGVGADESDQAFKFLSRSVYDATTQGGQFAESFQRLGIQLTDASGRARPLQEILFDLSDAMAKPENAANRTGIAMELLGRSGSRMVGLLSQGSAGLRRAGDQADACGATISDATAASAHQFSLLENQISLAWQGIENTLAEPLRIGLAPVLAEFIDWLKTHQSEVLSDVKIISAAVVDAVQVIITALENLKSALAGAAIGGIGGFILGGPLGALLGAAGGAAIGGEVGSAFNGSSPQQRIAVNVQPIDTSASFNQITAATQRGLRQQRDQFRSDQDLASRRMNIENGI